MPFGGKLLPKVYIILSTVLSTNVPDPSHNGGTNLTLSLIHQSSSSLGVVFFRLSFFQHYAIAIHNIIMPVPCHDGGETTHPVPGFYPYPSLDGGQLLKCADAKKLMLKPK